VRVLLHSNHPGAQTGYGIQTGQLARRLRDNGHEVAISVYYGHDFGLGQWEGIPLLPAYGDAYGNVSITEHAIRWFEGDPLGGWIIPFMDVFGLIGCAEQLRDFNVAPWTPVDHNPVPDACRDFFAKSEALPIACSLWGQSMLKGVGLDPLYAPCSIDTGIFRPIPDAKNVCGLEEDKFVVMMNGMNKGWAWDRKSFGEAFDAMGQFCRDHDDVLFYVHSEAYGQVAQGIDLVKRAMRAGIGEHQLKFVDQYAYNAGFVPPEQLAAVYSAADVLLAPSRGEGFGIPVIEAQACGTPVIVTNFAAQPELVGAGWSVPGQAVYEAAQQSYGVTPHIPGILKALEQAYEERGSEINSQAAINRAREYDCDTVFQKHWQPILEHLEGGDALPLDREPIPKSDAVAVIVPVLDRPQNVAPLVDSFNAASGRGVAKLYFVCDEDDAEQVAAVKESGAQLLFSTRGSTFAQKVNSGFEQTTEPWIFVCGDDVKFHRGWIDAARQLSDKFDVIGTNDSPEGTGNPRVASGGHSDHFFVRRAYADTYEASLGAPVCHEGYEHFYSDVEVIELAKARRVFSPCLASMVEHMHPDLKKAEVDDTYRKGWSARERDEREWRKRAPLVAMQREGAGKVRAA
jgi:glycosyltransferase involved in cell wall biosynthesis